MAKIKSTATKSIESSSSASNILDKLPKGDGPILYDKFNYMLMLLGGLFIVIGFVLMAGGANPDPAIFDEAEVYSSTRITVAPILIITGFIIEIFAVLKKPASA